MRLASCGVPVAVTRIAVNRPTKIRTSFYNLYILKYMYINLSYHGSISNYYVPTGRRKTMQQTGDWKIVGCSPMDIYDTKIMLNWDFYSGGYEEDHPQGCNAVSSEWKLTWVLEEYIFSVFCYILQFVFLLGLIFQSENRIDILLRKVGFH